MHQWIVVPRGRALEHGLCGYRYQGDEPHTVSIVLWPGGRQIIGDIAATMALGLHGLVEGGKVTASEDLRTGEDRSVRRRLTTITASRDEHDCCTSGKRCACLWGMSSPGEPQRKAGITPGTALAIMRLAMDSLGRRLGIPR